MTYQTTIYCFLYCCSCEEILAVHTAILDLCYLKYLLWCDVLDPREILPVLWFQRETLHGSEKHVTLKLTKSQCFCWITQRVWAERSRDLVGMVQLNKGSCSHGSASPELLEAKLQGASKSSLILWQLGWCICLLNGQLSSGFKIINQFLVLL